MRSARYLWPVILAGAAGWATGVHAAHAGGAYAVFQYSHRLQEFNRLEDAIAYAKLWDHSRVVNVMTGEDEWDNYPSPIADLGYWIVRDGQRLQAAWNRQEAIQAASRIPGSIVLNALTGTVVWRNSSVSQPVTGTAPPSKTPPGGFPSNPNSNQRIPDRPAPYGPDYYWVEGRTLYHIFGTPGAPARSTIVVGPAPDFLQPGQVYVRDSSHRFYLRDASGDHFIGTWVPPYEALDLRLPSSVSAEEIDRFIRSNHPESPLVGLGAAFIEAQKRYGVNAQYLAAHAILESGWGLSSIARDKNNLFGYGAYDQDPYHSAATFASFRDCIQFIAYFVRTQYLEPTGRWFGGAPTLDGMNVHYATDPDWAEKIAAIMERIRPYKASDYLTATPLPVTAPAPAGPVVRPPDPPPAPPAGGGTPDTRGGSGNTPQFPLPAGTTGHTTDTVNLREGPAIATRSLGLLPPGTTLSVTHRTADGWYKVSTGGRTGWVYGAYVQLDNRLIVKVDDVLNVRSGPGTSFRVLTQVPDGTVLVPITTNGGTPISIRNWYYVRLLDGTEGWVCGDYVVRPS